MSIEPEYAEQRVVVPAPVVPFDEDGARRLARAYWDEVARFSRGLVRARTTPEGTELMLLRVLPLLRFGPAETTSSPHALECRLPIRGGLLASEPGGHLLLAQRGEDEVELLLEVQGYRPRLAAAGRLARIRRRLFRALQVPLHDGVGRRFVARAVRGDL